MDDELKLVDGEWGVGVGEYEIGAGDWGFENMVWRIYCSSKVYFA